MVGACGVERYTDNTDGKIGHCLDGGMSEVGEVGTLETSACVGEGFAKWNQVGGRPSHS